MNIMIYRLLGRMSTRVEGRLADMGEVIDKFELICPKCKSTDCYIATTIYDDVVCKCTNCQYREDSYDEAGSERFDVVCPKCSRVDVTILMTIYDEYVVSCTDCKFKEYRVM